MPLSDLNRTIPALEKLAQTHACTLVDAEIVREGASRYLRIYIDKDGGVSLSDCEAYHRQVAPMVEHLDFDFLEVCSPGLDRPLRKPQDFIDHRGERVEVRLYRPHEGRKAFEGTLIGLEDGVLSLQMPEGLMQFGEKDVSVCKLVPQIDDELQQSFADDAAEEE